MSFREPAFLWLGLLLLVPLLLYLLPLPRRLVRASALYLWQRFLESERFGHTSERFRRALGFALLAAVLLSLVLAAADLAVGGAPTTARHVVVLVDASASMNAVAEGRSNLSRAKAAAAELVESLGSGTRVAVAEMTGELRVLRAMDEGGGDAAERVRAMESFDGPVDVRRMLADAWRLWGQQGEADVYVFTDDALPESPWGARAHAWVAPSAGGAGNAAVVEISAERVGGGDGQASERGRDIAVTFTLANYGPRPRALSGSILANGRLRGKFENVALEAGQTARRVVQFDKPGAAAVAVRLEGNQDALAADDAAYATVPALDEWRVNVAWPEGNRRNEYVSAVLAALQDEGAVGAVVEGVGAGAALTVYVNQLPATTPEGGAIVLYPLRSGLIQVAGLQSAPVTVARQARHELMVGVDLRGLPVKGAVQAAVPEWATVLAWADNGLPLVWAGQAAKTKVLFVGVPVMPSGSRLPLVSSFPVLMRNAARWMLPAAEALRPGERGGGAGSRRAGLVTGEDGRVHGFSVTSAAESDLRRAPGLRGETFGRRRSLAMLFVAIAALLLPVEWGLFHRRVTE